MKTALLVVLTMICAGPTAIAQLTIDFEELGTQPQNFWSTTPLTNQIAGATFAGPTPIDGGAILNQLGNFGVPPRSGEQFLAFNRVASYSSGGTATDPEHIVFAQVWSDVSIWAAGGVDTNTFTMRAFNSADVQIGSAQVSSQTWAELRIQAPGIVRIELTASIGDPYWVFDDLSASNGTTSTTYCTSGTTTNGCAATIDGVGVASASGSSAFTITVTNVEGQKQGLVFYGLDNTGFTPLAWGATTSYLCVKAPTQRTNTTSSGGTAGACDGALSLDWNGFLAAYPGALGAPFSAGQNVYAQGWFRDPPSSKTTNLSNALHFVVQP